jgi:hypothetical protein
MARLILLPHVCLGFDDPSRKETPAVASEEDAAEELARHLVGLTSVEVPRQRSLRDPSHALASRTVAKAWRQRDVRAGCILAGEPVGLNRDHAAQKLQRATKLDRRARGPDDGSGSRQRAAGMRSREEWMS